MPRLRWAKQIRFAFGMRVGWIGTLREWRPCRFHGCRTLVGDVTAGVVTFDPVLEGHDRGMICSEGVSVLSV
jgi:hypothetical protein